MRYCLAAFFLVAVFPAYLEAQTDWQDVVYLTDGSIIRGLIIEHIPSQSIRIQTSDGSVLVYSIDRVIRITKEPSMITREIRRKNPALACALSILIAGGGQAYNEEYGKAILYFGSAVTCWVIFLRQFEEDWRGRWYIPEYNERQAAFSFICWAVVQITQIVEAPISANRINKKALQPRVGKLLEYQGERTTLRINPISVSKGFGVMASLRF